jgi:hypothetical protein
MLPHLHVYQAYAHLSRGERLMNERATHHRVVPGLRRDAQTSASRSHASVQSADPWVCSGRDAPETSQRTAELESNGYFLLSTKVVGRSEKNAVKNS